MVEQKRRFVQNSLMRRTLTALLAGCMALNTSFVAFADAQPDTPVVETVQTSTGDDTIPDETADAAPDETADVTPDTTPDETPAAMPNETPAETPAAGGNPHASESIQTPSQTEGCICDPSIEGEGTHTNKDCPLYAETAPVCTCDPQVADDGKHTNKDCPLYAEAAPICTCDPQVADDGAHTNKDCPLYTETAPVCTCDPQVADDGKHTSKDCPLYTETAPVCTCDPQVADDGKHTSKDCPLYAEAAPVCALCGDQRLEEHKDGVCPVEPPICTVEHCEHIDADGKPLCDWGKWSLHFGDQPVLMETATTALTAPEYDSESKLLYANGFPLQAAKDGTITYQKSGSTEWTTLDEVNMKDVKVLYGGGRSGTTVASTHLIIDFPFKGTLYGGGGSDGEVEGDTCVEMKDYAAGTAVYGGGRGTVHGNTEVKITREEPPAADQTLRKVYGGGKGTVKKNTSLTLGKNVAAYQVYGGGDMCEEGKDQGYVGGDVLLTLEAGVTMRRLDKYDTKPAVYGTDSGNLAGRVGGDVTVHIDGATIGTIPDGWRIPDKASVIGHSGHESGVEKQINVSVSNSTVTGDIAGFSGGWDGTEASGVKLSLTNVTVDGEVRSGKIYEVKDASQKKLVLDGENKTGDASGWNGISINPKLDSMGFPEVELGDSFKGKKSVYLDLDVNIEPTTLAKEPMTFVKNATADQLEAFALPTYNLQDFALGYDAENQCIELLAKADAPPPAVTNLAATATKSGETWEVALAWDKVAEGLDYWIYRGTTADVAVAGKPMATTTALTWKDDTVEDGNTYYYKVCAVNSKNIAGTAAATSALCKIIIKPDAPTNLKAVSAGDATNVKQIKLTWTAPVGEGEKAPKTYHIYRSTSENGPFGTAIGTSASTSYADTKELTDKTTYYYTVRAANEKGTLGDFSNVAAVVCNEYFILPDPPKNLKAENDGTTTVALRVKLSWAVLIGEEDEEAFVHHIYRSTTANVSTDGEPFATAGQYDKFFYDTKDLKEGTTYYYKVVSENKKGTVSAEASNEVSVVCKPYRTRPGAPTVEAKNAGNEKDPNRIVLLWSTIIGLEGDHYKIYRSDSREVDLESAPLATTKETTYADTTVENGKTYYYQVVPYNASDMAGDGSKVTSAACKTYFIRPGKPYSLIAENAGDKLDTTQIKLSWAVPASTGDREAVSFVICRSTKLPIDASITYRTTKELFFIDDFNVEDGTKYYYQVVAVNAKGVEGMPSNIAKEVCKAYKPGKPDTPALFTAENAGDAETPMQIKLSWQDHVFPSTTKTAYYNIYRSLYESVDTDAEPYQKNITEKFYLDTEVSDGNTYYYKVVAVSAEEVRSNDSRECSVACAPYQEMKDPSGAGSISGHFSNPNVTVTFQTIGENDPALKVFDPVEEEPFLKCYDIALSEKNITSEGMILLTFELGTHEWDGWLIRVQHYNPETSDLEWFEREAIDGKVTVEVHSLSPFLLTAMKKLPTPNQPSGSSGGSGSRREEEQSEFWQAVQTKIHMAKTDDIIQVDAKNFDRLPDEVMNSLRKANVTLTIAWNGGETITIPAGQAQANDPGRIYWPLSKLVELYRDVRFVEEKNNPETGGYGYIEYASTGKTQLVTGSVQMLEAPERTDAPVAITPPTEGIAPVAAAAPRAQGSSMGWIVVALVMAAGGFWLWKRKHTAES